MAATGRCHSPTQSLSARRRHRDRACPTIATVVRRTAAWKGPDGDAAGSGEERHVPAPTSLQLHGVAIDKPDDASVIVGQSHFIKTVEDLHEALAGAAPQLRFGVAFCEASGARLVRRSGNDDALTALAARNAQAVAAGHAFIILLRDGFAINVLSHVKAVPEVCTVFCATANPVQVLVAETPAGRGVVGVIDGQPPVGVESDDDVGTRKDLLRALGYKL
jgi:adenosine/AMP kinase